MALATQIANPAPGRDARYSLSGLQRLPDGTYTDGTYRYDESGRGINRPNSTVSGLPPANASESYNVQTGQYSASGPLGGSGGGGGGGGGGSDLFANPYFQQAQAANQAQHAADLADTQAQLRQLLIQFGLVPQGFQDKLGALDEATKQLIAQNTESGVSQYARLQQSKEDTARGTTNALASRGLLRSGARGWNLRRNALTFNQGLSDALNAVLGTANQAQSGFAQRELARQQGLAQFLAQLSQSWAGQGVTPTTVQQYGDPTPPNSPAIPVAGFAHAGIGTPVSPGGPAIMTGGGYYNNAQKPNQLTSKWTKIGTMF